MIDTDKYEGHTEGPLEQFEGEGHKDLKSNMSFLMFGEVGKSQYPKPADAALIADAPLLLAEVKRLRSDMAYCASLITCMIDMGDLLCLSVVREGMLDSIGMTVDEAMATTDLMGDEEE